jgi:hypothetical protein
MLIYFTIKETYIIIWLNHLQYIPPRHEIVNIIKQNVNLAATSRLSLATTR